MAQMNIESASQRATFPEPPHQESPRTLTDLRGRPHLSVSALKLYLSCPRKFGFRYCTDQEPTHTPVALPFGKAFHDAAGFVLLQSARGRTPTAGERGAYFCDALHRELTADGPPVLFDDDEDEDTLRSSGQRMLAALFEAVGIPERILHVELPFSLQVHDPDTGEVLAVPLIGAIDAVVGTGRNVDMWELKSGKRRYSEEQVMYDLQSTAYWMALREKHPEIGIKLLVTTKAERPDVQIERLRRGQSDERDLLATVASVHRAVKAGCLHPVRSWACKSCEYAEACH